VGNEPELRAVDLADTGLVERLWRLGWDAVTPGRPWHVHATLPAYLAGLQPSPWVERQLVAAFVDGEPAGYGDLELSLRDNQHLAEMFVAVRPTARRRGLGRALYEALAARAGAAGRTTALAEVQTPPGQDTPGSCFLRALGFEVAQVEDMKVADLAVSASSWPALLETTTSAASAYRLVTWVDGCPDEHVDAFAELCARFLGEVPLEGLDVEPEVWDAARVRSHEDRIRRSERHEVTTMALAPDGSGAGYTELMWAEVRSELALQGATVVLPEHRGHRLGLRLKLVNQAGLRAENPGCDHILTGNATVNTHMNAVNDQLGFRVVEQSFEMQRRL
jgi:GNAT superfamily N-acetyltransferase